MSTHGAGDAGGDPNKGGKKKRDKPAKAKRDKQGSSSSSSSSGIELIPGSDRLPPLPTFCREPVAENVTATAGATRKTTLPFDPTHAYGAGLGDGEYKQQLV